MKNTSKIKELEIDEIFIAEVKKHGNGARIPFVKEHIGKDVFIIIPKKR